MEENKYYYPNSIEELSIGMEVEIKGYDKWVTSDVQLYNIELYADYVEGKSLRIPYLTEQDIIDEGFELVDSSVGTSGLRVRFKMLDTTLEIFEYKHLFVYESENYDVTFNGFIKNKTDFTRLLKQLNIK